MLTFVPLQEAFVRPLRGAQPGGFGAAGLEVRAAGRRACERTGLYCYKFHHLFQMRKMESVEVRGGGGGRFYLALMVLFQLSQFDSHRSEKSGLIRKKTKKEELTETKAEKVSTQTED